MTDTITIVYKLPDCGGALFESTWPIQLGGDKETVKAMLVNLERSPRGDQRTIIVQQVYKTHTVKTNLNGILSEDR